MKTIDETTMLGALEASAWEQGQRASGHAFQYVTQHVISSTGTPHIDRRHTLIELAWLLTMRAKRNKS